MATLAPALVRRREVAAPMPLLPPVMRAVLPASGPDIFAVGGCFLDRTGRCWSFWYIEISIRRTVVWWCVD